MKIERLRLKEFRNFTELDLTPHPGMNLFFGHNGAGKTNLLEAIHYCALGRSHRTAADRDAVRRDEAAGAVGVTVLSDSGSRSEISIRLNPGEAKGKAVFIDRKRAPRMADLMGHLRCVIFSPEDLMLVREGPSVRRRFLDMLLSQLDPAYFLALQRYNRALEQRNSLLREQKRTGRADSDLLFSYERLMAEAASVIIPKRRASGERLRAIAAEKYAAVCGRETEVFDLRYQPCTEAADPGIIREEAGLIWKGRRDEDRLRGGTSFGPHREDLRLTLDGREMKLYASQGQIRTAALAMKLAQLALIEEVGGEKPVLLLDDVMSELDMTRRTRLLREIGGAQTFVTCTDESDLEGLSERRTYRVSLGADGCARVTETRPGETVAAAPENTAEPDFS